MSIGSSMLAAFVWPALFWGGAAAVAAPILIHLFARRRFKRIRWAAVEFLLQAERRNKRRVRMEELILLAMRCLIVLLIALLVSRPFLRPQGLAALLGGVDRTERIFLIDDSYSMGYLSGEDTSFDRARQAVIRITELLRERTPNDTVTVLRTSDVTSPVAAGVFLDDRQTEDLFARLEAIKVSERAMSVRDTIESVRKMLDDQPDTLNVALYLVSDFQRTDWIDTERSQGEATRGPIAPLASWGNDDRSLKLVLVDVGDDSARNTAITDLSSLRSRFVAGVAGEVRAKVANYSDRATDSIDLEVTVGPTVQPTVTVDAVEALGSAEVSLFVAVPHPGWQPIAIRTPGDSLPVDDQRTLVVEAVEAVRTLVVNGEPSSDAYRDEVTFLRTALRPTGEVFSGNDVEVIDETEFDTIDLSQFDVIILANVYRVGEATAELLSDFTNRGGGLAIFLGDQVDPASYNETLYKNGRGLLPAELGERTSARASGEHIAVSDFLHPVVAVFGGRDNPFVSKINFTQYFNCTPAGMGGDADDASATVAAARVIAHYDDPQSTPAMVERAFGSGRVMLLTSSCDQEWNDWARDPSYVVTMLELVQYLARGAGAMSDLTVGSPITLSLDPGRYDPDVLVRTPGYPAEREIPVTALPAEDGRGFKVDWLRTDRSGVYQFVMRTRSGEEEIKAVAVNLDPGEGDLSPATESDLVRAIPEMPFVYLDGLGSIGEVGSDARRELWRSVLAAAVFLLMGEQLLGWWFGRRS
jgi:Aerotolerance regulator N-terminal/von Willebrand factor type A domain